MADLKSPNPSPEYGEEIKKILQRGFLPEEIKLFEYVQRIHTMHTVYLSSLQSAYNAPKLQEYVNNLHKLVSKREQSFRKNFETARQKLHQYRSALPRLKRKEREKFKEELYAVLENYLRDRDNLSAGVRRILEFFTTLYQSIEVRGDLPLYCPKCQTVYSQVMLLERSLPLRLRHVEPIQEGETIVGFARTPLPEEEYDKLVRATLSACPQCRNPLQSLRDVDVLEKHTATKEHSLAVILPKTPSRLGAKLAIFPPFIPNLGNAEIQRIAEQYIAAKMRELKHKLYLALERHARSNLKSQRLVAAYMRSVRIDVNDENVITVEITTPLGKKIEFGKERYPLWNVLKKFKKAKGRSGNAGSTYAIIPLQVSFEDIRRGITSIRDYFAYSRLVSGIRKGVKISRFRFRYLETKTHKLKSGREVSRLVHVYKPYRKVTGIGSLSKQMGGGLVEGKAPRFEMHPKAKEIAEILHERFRSSTLKTALERWKEKQEKTAKEGRTKKPKLPFIYRQATITHRPIRGGVKEVGGGLVWFRTLSEKNATRSFIIPAVKPLYGLEYLAQLGYQEVSAILTNLASRIESLKKDYRGKFGFLAVLPHEVRRLYGSEILTLERTPQQIEETLREYQAPDIKTIVSRFSKVGPKTRVSLAHSGPRGVVDYWYSVVLGAGNLKRE